MTYKKEVDQMTKDIIAKGLCVMCDAPLPKINKVGYVACKDCMDYTFDAVGVPNENS